MLGRQCPWGNFKWTRAGLAKLEQVGLLYGLGGHLAGRAGAHWLGGAETRLLLLLGSSRKLLLLDKLLLRLLLHKLLLRLLLDNCCQGCCCTICCCWGWATCCGWGWETSCCWLWKNWAACCWRAWNDCCCWPADTCSCCWGANLCCWGANCWGCAGRGSIWPMAILVFVARESRCYWFTKVHCCLLILSALLFVYCSVLSFLGSPGLTLDTLCSLLRTSRWCWACRSPWT